MKVLVVGDNSVGKLVAFNLAMSTVSKSDYAHLIEQKVEETQQLLSVLNDEVQTEYKSGREKRRERRKQNRKL
jgi:hypothetical protein